MEVVHTIPELRAAVARARQAGQIVGFVPTMGCLHEGHLSLIRRAKEESGYVVVSIFVNPTQFGPTEDFSKYPRTFEDDRRGCEAAGADLIFAPAAADFYPTGASTWVDVEGISAKLCGEFRPGHFRGVATVVLKLFNMVMPHAAIFGKKDYQQYLVLRDMVRQFALPVEIIPAETVRATDGLALSSRNGYLGTAERAEAPRLYASLRDAQKRMVGGERNFQRIELETMALLSQNGWTPQYIAVRRRADLQAPAPEERELVMLAAAYLGKTRLIDNIEVTL